MASAASRVRMKEQSDWMVETADSLAKSYSPDRYDSPSTTNMSNARLTTDFENLPATVPMEVLAIWFHHGVEELTPEEEVQYEKYLQQQVRPPPVHSPHLPRPRVNWAKLNPFQHRNLPKPELFSVQGCSLITTFLYKN